MTPEDIAAAAERRRKHYEATKNDFNFRQSPYCVATADGSWWWDAEVMEQDESILADAYLALGERREDKWAVKEEDGCVVTYGKDRGYAEVVAEDSGGIVLRVATFVKPVEDTTHAD